MRGPPALNVPVEPEGAEGTGNRNEGMLPPQPVPVGGRLCQFVEGWKRITNDPYVTKYHDQGVQTLFYKSTSSAQDPMGNKISPGTLEDPRNARAHILDASKEHNNRGARYARVLLERIPGTQSVWRVAPSNRLETTERPYLHCTHLTFTCTP